MSWPLAEQSRRNVAVPQSSRQTPRIMWAVVLAAFVCGAAVSAAGFSIGWKHQAQKGTSAESALVAANAHAFAIVRSRATLRTSLAKLHTQLASAQQALAATSSQAAPLSGDLARLTNELRALTSYVTSTPPSQLDAGYLQAQIAYVSKTATGLSSALAALASPTN